MLQFIKEVNEMLKVLVVEDNPDISELLYTYLKNENYDVTIVSDGEEAIHIYYDIVPDLILLDLMLPKINGYDVCKSIREDSDVPIIMLTALDEEKNQLKGFELKIDDYITKPFSMPILIHKIEAVMRRYTNTEELSQLKYENLILNLSAFTATYNGEDIELTKREFLLLQILLENRGRVLTRQALLNQVWDYDFFGDERIVDTHIKNLRKKLPIEFIETVRGVGYKIDK